MPNFIAKMNSKEIGENTFWAKNMDKLPKTSIAPYNGDLWNFIGCEHNEPSSLGLREQNVKENKIGLMYVIS